MTDQSTTQATIEIETKDARAYAIQEHTGEWRLYDEEYDPLRDAILGDDSLSEDEVRSRALIYLRAYKFGYERGMSYGRLGLQIELKTLLGVPPHD
jgi:uncharacterized protein YtpQ (UPF0354 family)